MTGKTECNAWYLRLFGESHARYGFTADELDSRNSSRDEVVAIFREYSSSEEPDLEMFPKMYWLNPARIGNHGRVLPHAHVAGDFLTVSPSFLEVLNRFDLGAFKSWPVTLLKKDRKTPAGGTWYAVWVGNRKEGFLRDRSQNFSIPKNEHLQDLSVPKEEASDGDFVMDISVRDGPDIWRDPKLEKTLMVSDRLHSTLKDAGLLSKIKVLRCPLVPTI